MPETPDFEQIALRIIETLLDRAGEDLVSPSVQSKARAQVDVAVQLRNVWNARGVADVVAIRSRMSTLTGWLASEPYLQHVAEAVAEIDR